MQHAATDHGAPRAFTLTLLIGAALLGAGAALHPMLPLDVGGQLRVIARTPAWRTIHVVMIAGSVLVIAGLGTLLDLVDRPARRALGVVLATIALGLVLNAVDIAFMARVGPSDAARYASGHDAVATAFATGHATSLAVARVGNVLVAVGCLVIGALQWRSSRAVRPLAVFAWVAGVTGIVGVVAFDPASREAVAAVALFTTWAGINALLELWPARRPPWPPPPPARE